LAKHQHSFEFEVFDSGAELDSSARNLLNEAIRATSTAYAPYSGFFVGCAVLLADGTIVKGSNQENRAFPSGLCAERTALFQVGSLGRYADIVAIAVRARFPKSPVEKPIAPCGACRQVMVEAEKLADRKIVVYLQGEIGKILRINGISGNLLPFEFDFDFG